MKKTWEWLDKNTEELLMMVLLVVICCVMMFQIIRRYIFGTALVWAEEICRYCFVYTGCLSLGYCVRRQKMLKIDILVSHFPATLQIIMDFLSRCVGLLYYSLIFWTSISYVSNIYAQRMSSTGLGLPMWIVYFAVELGFFIAMVRQIQDLILFVLNLHKKGDPLK